MQNVPAACGGRDVCLRNFRTSSVANLHRDMVYCKGKIRTRFFRYLLSALPFIVFVILGYYCILFAATHLKILPQKVQSNQKRQDGRSGAAKPAARAVWHGQGFQQCMGVPVSAFDRVGILPLQYSFFLLFVIQNGYLTDRSAHFIIIVKGTGSVIRCKRKNIRR